MRRGSLKLKLTLLYTLFMVLITCSVLALLLSLSNRELLASVQMKLESRVQESVDDISLEDGRIVLDPDFYTVERDVYISLYDSELYFLYGKIPYGFDYQPEFSDGQTRTIREGNVEWYVYDMSFRLSRDQTVYVRGITSLTDAEENLMATVRIALILLPLLVLATALIGYLFTSRTLRPVRVITSTVQGIRRDADLSRRIGITKAAGKKGDEIYTLAVTFDEMLEELENVFDREKQFTSDVSHELRTPVSVILAQCGQLAEDNTLSEEQRAQIYVIEKKAKAMSEMISRLLFLSRADQGRQLLCREYLNISELTEMTVEEQRFLAETSERNIRFDTHIQEEVYARADETLYIRLLINLLSNAVRYSRENGLIEVYLEEHEGCIYGTVTDHGEGISPDCLPHIWERFYRADAARTEGEHSGLGLSMVKWIAEAHGGGVAVESEEGKGSSFSFWMPSDSEK